MENNIYITKFFCNQSFLIFLGFLSCFLFQLLSSYLCFFLILSYVFLFNMNVIGFKTSKLKIQKKNTQMFGQKEGCNKSVFSNLCFAKCEKLSFFWVIYLANFG